MKDNLYTLVLLGTSGGIFLASSVIFFYIRYQGRFLRQKAERQQAELEHRQQLLYSIIRSQEEERIRISKDLHDHVGSSLSNLRFMVSRMGETAAANAEIKQLSAEYKTNIDRIITDVRNISHSLSPAGLELWGFHEALAELCEQMSRSTGLGIHVTDDSGGAFKQLPFDIALSLFRVVQELLANTVKHAAAKQVKITTGKADGYLTISYTDDGKGMSEGGKHGIGLYNIESRLDMAGAAYDVVSAPGAGYSFTIKLPENRPL